MSTKKKIAKEKITNNHLLSWAMLNDYIMTCTEKQAVKLLQEEIEGRRRMAFIKRIHSRVNKLRADRERGELEAKL
jgi:hypothetical protein